MERELLEGEARVGDAIMTGREWAADQLLQVSHETESGNYPEHISAFDLGRAVGRALSNCNEHDPLGELVRGYTHYLVAKRTYKSNGE